MTSWLDRYLPQDRHRALVAGTTLPERCDGAALFADLVGFTPLGHQLTRELGVRRGVEELVRRVDALYDSLISAIETRGGSVIGFAGDGLTCWFDAAEPDSPARALSCAQAMQQAMQSFAGVRLRTAVTYGPARRLVVGDPNIQLIDTLVGATVARLAAIERIARHGEVVVDQALVKALGQTGEIREWRVDSGGETFGVADTAAPLPGFSGVTPAAPRYKQATLDHEMLRPWILPPVYEREQSGYGAFLTELRPTVAMFVRLEGIDYDADERAGEKLDRLVRTVQRTLASHDGLLLQLTIGDKGSYCLGSFGAPVAHENDVLRAVRAAHELMRQLLELTFLVPAKIGLSAGTSRTGAYGGRTRATYGTLGDDVNLAARLMGIARPGEILLGDALRRPAMQQFVLRTLQPLQVKGFSEPVIAHALIGPRGVTHRRLHERRYGQIMVGRQHELALIERKLMRAVEGEPQVIAILGDAGIGKSRLLAEAAPFAQRHGFSAITGVCEASGRSTPYLAWRPVWRALLEVGAESDSVAGVAQLRERLRRLAPQRLNALPTLAPLLGMTIRDNMFTRTLTPQERVNLVTGLLEDCLRAVATTQPLLVALEDVQWMDALSLQLLEGLARPDIALPLAFVLTYRPARDTGDWQPRIERLPGFTRIALDALDPGDVERLIDNKLSQWEPDRSDVLAAALAARLNPRAEGNPFYVEELLNDLRERRGSQPEWLADARGAALELPASLESLILSRIDRLTESQRAILKTASVMGRRFRVNWLHGCYPGLGELEQLKADLVALERLDLTLCEAAQPDLAYRFKHMVTHEVTYVSLPSATRAQMHGQVARYIESLEAERHLDLLAHHYGLSDDSAKQREYLRRAAEAAQAAYANDTALSHWKRLLTLVQDDGERARVQLQLGVLLTQIARYVEAETCLRDALQLTAKAGDDASQAAVAEAMGRQFLGRGSFRNARQWLDRALTTWQALGARREEGKAMLAKALTWLPERFDEVRGLSDRALTIANQCGDVATEILAAAELGHSITHLGDGRRGSALLEDAIERARRLDDSHVLITALSRQASAAASSSDFVRAKALFLEAQRLDQEIGAQRRLAGGQGGGPADCSSEHDLPAHARLDAAAIAGVAVGTLRQCDFALARAGREEVLTLAAAMSDPLRECRILIALGYADLRAGELDSATASLLRAGSVVSAYQLPMMQAEVLDNLGLVALARGELVQAGSYMRESLIMRRRIGSVLRIVYSLSSLTALLARSGPAREAAVIAAAVRRACVMHGLALDGATQAALDESLATARASLRTHEPESTWAEGATLDLGDAARLALAA